MSSSSTASPNLTRRLEKLGWGPNVHNRTYSHGIQEGGADYTEVWNQHTGRGVRVPRLAFPQPPDVTSHGLRSAQRSSRASTAGSPSKTPGRYPNTPANSHRRATVHTGTEKPPRPPDTARCRTADPSVMNPRRIPSQTHRTYGHSISQKSPRRHLGVSGTTGGGMEVWTPAPPPTVNHAPSRKMTPRSKLASYISGVASSVNSKQASPPQASGNRQAQAPSRESSSVGDASTRPTSSASNVSALSQAIGVLLRTPRKKTRRKKPKTEALSATMAIAREQREEREEARRALERDMDEEIVMPDEPLGGWTTAPPSTAPRTSAMISEGGLFEDMEEPQFSGRLQTEERSRSPSSVNSYDDSSQLRKFFDEAGRKKAREALKDRVNYDIQLYLSASWELQEKYWSPRPITRDRLADLSTPRSTPATTYRIKTPREVAVEKEEKKLAKDHLAWADKYTEYLIQRRRKTAAEAMAKRGQAEKVKRKLHAWKAEEEAHLAAAREERLATERQWRQHTRDMAQQAEINAGNAVQVYCQARAQAVHRGKQLHSQRTGSFWHET
mmetsp:Transcript_7689/g.15646  ORF Transcript_7689/g.15646 Transcript_7689/m.15646 type:complete len:556 (-) Transcript_7689:253-1920(-)